MPSGASEVDSIGLENRLSSLVLSLIPNSAPIGASEVDSIDWQNLTDPFKQSLSLKMPVVVRVREMQPRQTFVKTPLDRRNSAG